MTLPASQEAAVVAASYGVLVRLFPAAKPALDAQYAASLAQIPEGDSKTNGIAVGEFVAEEMVSLRSADGSAPISYTLPPAGLGIWRPTSPGAPAVPQWGGMTPFVLESATQFNVAGPPELTTADYAADVNEVKFYGGTTSLLRTPDQTEIARFWAESTAISFNRIARAMAAERQTGLAENARLFALMNMALSDAYVVVFETKYRFNFWRPIHAIRENDGTTRYDDGNPDTVPDPTWTPLLATPAHPEYLSGHSGTASAAAEVLTDFFGQHAGFSTTSTTLPGVVRSLSSFRDAVSEVADARVFGGIHFRRTCLLSNVVGKKIGKFAMKNYLRPLGDDRSESQ
ncbi:MAG TPA: vanadium-dependent haloperoxidase [Pyrinomonadaceae bacterium]|nr:vanadium-dependent haloperoxidase [Pyrinomonadaceae bacterium]